MTTMSGHEPEKAGHCLCLLLNRLEASSSRAQGSEDFRLHVTVKRLIGHRCLPHQAWRRLSGVAVAFPGPVHRRPTTYYSSSLPAAPVHARRLLVVVAEGGWGGAGDLLRLLLRQYVEESFGARPEWSRRFPSSAPATVRPRELRSARRPWLKWCRQKEGTKGE